MVLGKPFSQPIGAFQGRTDALLESCVLAQPEMANTDSSKLTHRSARQASLFMTQDEQE